MFRQLELTKENKRLLIKFAVSLLVTVLLTVMLCTLSAFAEQGTADSGAVRAVSTAEAQQDRKSTRLNSSHPSSSRMPSSA